MTLTSCFILGIVLTLVSSCWLFWGLKDLKCKKREGISLLALVIGEGILGIRVSIPAMFLFISLCLVLYGSGLIQ